jgi:hypothetical protein
MRSKTIQQSGYLIVKGLLKKKGNGDELFNMETGDAYVFDEENNRWVLL